MPALPDPASGSGERVLFVHAHPDDETITTGGTIALLVEAGTQVSVVTCTRGESGEVIPADLQHLVGDEAALAAHRETEIAEAMLVLGVTDHRWLGATGARILDSVPRRYRDSGMAWGVAGPVRLETMADDALCAADLGEIAADIATVIATSGATAVVSYDENGGYGHPDHIMTRDAAIHAAEVMGVPFFEIDGPDAAAAAHPTSARPTAAHPTVRLDVAPVLGRKVAALRAYRSQLTVDGDRLIMPGGQIEPITDVESFSRVRRGSESRTGWSDFGLGIRVVTCVVALVAGAAVGALGTVNHQLRVGMLGVGVPVGLIAALLVIAALLTGLRLVFDTRTATACAALGILSVIGILSLESAGGSVLIPDLPLSYYWLYGPTIITAVVLAWPKIVQPTRDTIAQPQQSKGTPAQ